MKNTDIKINVSTKEAEKRLQKATRAAENLEKALERLKNIEIGISVVSVEKKWWQFWL